MESLYLKMFGLREQLKLLHFQTTVYSVHKTTDAFLIEYDALLDSFWETLQKDGPRITLSDTGASLVLQNVRSYAGLQPIIDDVIGTIMANSDSLPSGERDTMLDSLNKFKYLMSFN
jgi:hypothetical protein